MNVGDLEIELIIGCVTPEAHWSLDQRVRNIHQPFAVKIFFGWILFGPLGKDNATTNLLCLLSSCKEIEQQLHNRYIIVNLKTFQNIVRCPLRIQKLLSKYQRLYLWRMVIL